MYIKMKVKSTSFFMLAGVLLLLLFFTLSFTGLRGKEGFGLEGMSMPDGNDMSMYGGMPDENDMSMYGGMPDGNDINMNDGMHDGMSKKNTKKEGFEGELPILRPEKSNANEKILDVFSHVEAKVSCDNVSSQLHNSRGGLCLTNDIQKLLKTRGGNSTSGESQIGF